MALESQGISALANQPSSGGGPGPQGNLIQQQQMLRGLPDEALPKIMQSGSAPPFLVAAEMKRRETDRDHYSQAITKYNANKSTVVEDLMRKAQTAGSGIGAMMPPQQQAQAPMGPAPVGLEAMAQQQPVQHFANGSQGLVQQQYMGGYTPPQAALSLPNSMVSDAFSAATGPGTNTYASHLPAAMDSLRTRLGGVSPTTGQNADALSGLAKLFSDRQSAIDKERKMAVAMALIKGGAAAMSGKHSSTFANLGEGFSAGADALSTGLTQTAQDEQSLLNNRIALASDQQSQSNSDRSFKLEQQRADQAGMPASVQTAMWAADPNRTEAEKAALADAQKQGDIALATKAQQEYAAFKSNLQRQAVRSDGTFSDLVPQDIVAGLQSSDANAHQQALIAFQTWLEEQARASFLDTHPVEDLRFLGQGSDTGGQQQTGSSGEVIRESSSFFP